tara:strand:+ start:465 stop:842 length:378 start_codon:yes stop_codon:yes gene_type:complete
LAGRRSDQWRTLPPLCRERARPDPQAGRYCHPRQSQETVGSEDGSHKNKAARRAIRAVGAKLLFLPKYSPDFNPIEQLFAKLKHFLRNAAKRTREDLCDAVGEILRDVTCDECRNYLVNSGYGRT